MRRVRILEIGDMQNGFMREDGNLYVGGAHAIIAPANDFLQQLPGSAFDLTLIVQDTHFREAYPHSEEGRTFPIHCEYGTRDWELAVTVPDLPKTRYLMKDRYSMWSDPVPGAIPPGDPARQRAYGHRFQIVDDPRGPTESTPRDEYLGAIGLGRAAADVDVTVIGVASDYCIRYAVEGWLARGARVTILSDLTKGIAKETGEVIAEDRFRPYADGRLRSVESAAFLEELATR